MSALENVMVGRHRHESTGILRRSPASARRSRAEPRDARSRGGSARRASGCAAAAERPAGSLPYGALKRLEIARALASEPKVLLLDEPAAGCNAVETAEIEAIIRGIARDGITVVLVEHDMRLVMNVSDRIHVLDHGRTLAEGTAAEVRANPAVIEAYLGLHGRAGDRPCCRSRTCKSGYGRIEALKGVSIEVRPARSSAWSAATAPARPRCCARSRACSR